MNKINSFWKSDYHVGWSTFWRQFNFHDNPEIPSAHDLLKMLGYWNGFLATPYTCWREGIPLKEAQLWVNIRAGWAIEFLKKEAERQGLNSQTIDQMHKAIRPYGQQIKPRQFDGEEALRVSFSTMDFLSNVQTYFEKSPSVNESELIQCGIAELMRLEVKLGNDAAQNRASVTTTNDSIIEVTPTWLMGKMGITERQFSLRRGNVAKQKRGYRRAFTNSELKALYELDTWKPKERDVLISVMKQNGMMDDHGNPKATSRRVGLRPT